MPDLPARRARPAVLFDLDGTLIDSLELLVRSMQHAFAGYPGPAPDVGTWVSYIGRTLWWQFSQFAPESEIPALVQRYRDFQTANLHRLTRCYDGIPLLVARLHEDGHPLGVVTSKIERIARQSLDVVALSPFLDVVVGADSTVLHKPDPEPVRFALERLALTPGQAVFVGDSPFDVLAGNAAGVATVAVTWGAASLEALLAAAPTHVAGSVDELDRLLAQLARDEHRRE